MKPKKHTWIPSVFSRLLTGLLILGTLLSLSQPAGGAPAGQEPPPEEGPVVIYRGVSTAVKFDISPPLRSIPPAKIDPNQRFEDWDPPDIRQGPPGPQSTDPVVQTTVGSGEIPSPLITFDGFDNQLTYTPPDPVGDVGPNHYVAMANVHFAVYDKSGNLLYGPVPNNTLWSGFGGACEAENSGDPIVVYDQLADRWMLTQFTSGGPTYYNCVALSVSGDPTGSYYRWAFSTGSNFPDYPKYGVWPDAYYITTREFSGGSQVGIGVYALNRAQMLAGNPSPQVISFLTPYDYRSGHGLLPPDLDGTLLPPAGSPAPFVGTMDDGAGLGAPYDAVTLWRFHVDWAVPGNSTFTYYGALAVAPFDSIFPCSPGSRDCIPQPGTSEKLDILSYRQRPMWRLAYRNFGTHESLVTNQSVEAAPNMAGIRWYEIRDPNGTPYIYQQGTYAPGVSDGIHRWMGSIAMDHVGNMALGYSASNGTDTYPSVWYTGRLVTDPLGTMPQGEGVIVNGMGSQLSTGSRWGDYTSMNVDPVDDCTFWYINEYYKVTHQTEWNLRIGAFRFPNCIGCASGVNVAPPTAAQSGEPGTEVVYTLRITNTGNCTDAYNVSISGNAWPVSAPEVVGPLSAGAGTSLNVTVTIPAGAPCGTSDAATVRFTSQGDGNIWAESLLTTTAEAAYGVEVAPPTAAQVGEPGTEVVYTLHVTNSGNCTDTFDLSLGGNAWPVEAPAEVGPLPGGAGVEVGITVTIPAGLPCGERDTATVTLTSQSDGSRSDASLLTTTAGLSAGVEVAPPTAAQVGEPGTEVVYTLHITNTGNCTDTFDLSIGGNAWPVEAPAEVGPLPGGAGSNVHITVTIPAGAPCGTSDAATVRFTSQGDGSIWAESLLTTTAEAVYGVEVAPPTAAQVGEPGTEVVYTLRVTNTGNCTDTFDLSLGGNAWPVEAPAAVGPLPGGAGVEVGITVTIPAGLPCGERDTATVTLTSQSDGSHSDASLLTTMAGIVAGVEVVPPTAAQVGEPGTEVVYTLHITNTGNCTDTFDLSLGGNAWPVEAPAAVGPLPGGAGSNVHITVTIPAGAPCGTSDAATVRFTSQGDGSIWAESLLTTTAEAAYGVEVAPPTAAQVGEPGTEVVYTLRITNTGNCTDTFDLSLGGNAWPVEAPAEVGPLPGGAGSNVHITVTIPAGAPCGTSDAATVRFTSQGDGSIWAESLLTTTVEAVYGVEVVPPTVMQVGKPGTGVVYTLHVTNTGNCTDTFVLSLGGNAWPVEAPAEVGPLPSGASADVPLTVTIPAGARCGENDAATITLTSQNDGATSDESLLTTVAGIVAGVEVVPPTAAQVGEPGTEVVYTLRVTNTGNCTDTFDLSVSGNTWPVEVPAVVGPLASGASAVVNITVTIPIGSENGAQDAVTVAFVSRGNGNISDTSVLTTTAVIERWTLYLPLVLRGFLQQTVIGSGPSSLLYPQFPTPYPLSPTLDRRSR